MRRRTTSLTTICLVALAAFLSSACVLVVDHGPDRDAQFHFSSRGLADRFEVWVDGSVTFSDDDTSVARIAPGGFLHIEERLAFRTRRVTVEPAPSGGVQVTLPSTVVVNATTRRVATSWPVSSCRSFG